MGLTPKDVVKLVKDSNVKMIDFKFVDMPGVWQHYSIPAYRLDEALFEDGIGFDLMFTPVTCLKKPLPGLAIKAANMIWSEVRNSGKGKFKRQVNIAPALAVRNSCGTI